MSVRLEHVNFTVSDPQRTAEALCTLFGWKIRWKGLSGLGGQSVHVGTDDDYVALYTPGQISDAPMRSALMRGGMNHVGVVVDDIEDVEARVKAFGYRPFNHADYEPGRRFYFLDADGIEFEVVSYAKAPAAA